MAGHLSTNTDQPRERIPAAARPAFDAIAALIDDVCLRLLDEEYRQISRKMAAVLARKRPSPLLRGRANTWACAIVYAVGSVNFLSDRSESPYLSADVLCGAFGVAKSTGGAKATELRKLLRLGPFDPEWTLPSRIDRNPLAWLISVRGLLIDARYAPREIQEEAYRLGLIPYLPAEGAGRVPSARE